MGHGPVAPSKLSNVATRPMATGPWPWACGHGPMGHGLWAYALLAVAHGHGPCGHIAKLARPLACLPLAYHLLPCHLLATPPSLLGHGAMVQGHGPVGP